MPRGRATRGKRRANSVPSSCESLEDEVLIMDHEDVTEKRRSKLPESSNCNKDQENGETSDLSSVDPDSEMKKTLQLLVNGMTTSEATKRQKIKYFTDEAIKINIDKMSKAWNDQLKRYTTIVENNYQRIREKVTMWEEDLGHQNEQCEKVNNIVLEQLKVQQQIYSSNKKRLASIISMHQSFSKDIKNHQEKFTEITTSVNEEMKTELLLLQKKTIMKTQQQHLQEGRKYVQKMLFS